MAGTPTFSDYLASVNLSLDGVEPDARGTIRPPDVDEPPPADVLPFVAVAPDGDFVPGDLLGEGGMGRVVNARQVALGRDVAVKVLKAGKGTRARADLLHEARITGRLEHPNVVPVYLLGKNADGQALFVMRRIAGHPWSALLAAPDVHRALVGTDPLGFHVGVLAQVAQAVRFAHERGVVHRDLKPDNVMIGEFGEVYLVDWGIAVVTEPTEPPLPLARDTKGLAGSPAYMAPEMAMGDGPRIGPWSDVYLLGAILHQLLAGEVRHRGDTLMEALSSAFESAPPAYGPDAPAALADLATRAMAPEPEARPTADAFRRALLDWVALRPAFALLAEGRRRVDAAIAAIATGGDPREPAAEARVLLQQAKTALPDAIAADLDRLVRAMVAADLARHEVEAAATWLADLPVPDAALSAEVAQARARRARDLAALIRAADVTLGARERKWVMFFEALAFGGGGVTAHLLAWPLGYWVAWFVTAAMSAVLVPFAVWMVIAPDRQNTLTRGLFYNIVLSMVLLADVFLVGWVLDRPFVETMAFTHVLSAGILGTIATLVEPRAVVGALFIGAGALAIALWPNAAWLATGLSSGAGFLAMAAVWALQERRRL